MIVENSFRCFIFLYNRKVNTFTETLGLGAVVLGLGVFEVSHIRPGERSARRHPQRGLAGLACCSKDMRSC